MRRIPKFSPKTRAILSSISRDPLTVAEICAATRLPPKQVHPRIQNAVRSGYAIVAGEAAIQGSRVARRYSAVETTEQIEPFKATDGRFDISELLRQVGPSALDLPEGKRRLVRQMGDEESSREFESEC